MYVVATVVHVNESSLFGDIILITQDKRHAKTITYTVKEKRPLEGLDYEKLMAFDDVIYFEREVESYRGHHYGHIAIASRDTVNFIIEEDEYNLVKNTPVKDLPLLIGTLQFEYNNAILENRLKEGK